MNLSVDIRLKAYLHWLWHGGQPPRIDASDQQQRRQINTNTYTDYTPAMSQHSNHSGNRGSSRRPANNPMLEHISASSIQSGGGRSIRSVRSDVSAHSVTSNASLGSNRSQHSSDGRGDLGPVLMIDILVTQHIDFKLSCYQLSMASKLRHEHVPCILSICATHCYLIKYVVICYRMLSNLSVIMEQRKNKRNQIIQRRRSSMTGKQASASNLNSSTIGSVIGVETQKKHKRRASAPATSITNSRNNSQNASQENSNEQSLGWFAWVGSFFYDVKY